MANEEQLAILRSGVDKWNAWNLIHRVLTDLLGADRTMVDLRGADLTGVDLRGADLREADLRGADLTGVDLTVVDLREAKLRGADLTRANLSEVNLMEVDLRRTDLTRADLRKADLTRADLVEANLTGADLAGALLVEANLTGANLTGADLTQASLVKASFVDAALDDCTVYGISAWNVQLDGATQANLCITPWNEPEITVDNLQVAQFLYLMLHNEEIRSIIDTLTSKVVLLLGRFSEDRKPVLEALRDALRQHGYVPVLFDFAGPRTRNMTETITLLARMARFIIADLTDPASIPQELQAIVPNVHVPVQPIIAGDAKPYAMFADYRVYPWMLKEHRYAGLDSLITVLGDQIIAPAEAKVKEIRKLRQSVEDDEA